VLYRHRFERRDSNAAAALSDLGRLAYTHYWSCTLARAILAMPSKRTITIADLRDETYITVDDIIVTLQDMGVLEHRKRGGADAVVNKVSVRAWAERGNVDLREIVDSEAFMVASSEEESEGDDDEEDEDEEMEG
jgi:hypothetical protein